MDRRLYWLALGSFCIGAEGFVASSLLPAIAADTGVPIAQSGQLVLVFALVCAVGGPILASLFGHRDRRVLLTASALVFAIGNLVAAVAHSFDQLLLARAIMALGACLYAPTAQAAAVAISAPHHRARAISVILGGTTVAIALGAPVGALIGTFFGWRGTFLTLAILSFASTLAIGLQLPSGLVGDRLALRDRFAVIGRPGVATALLTTVLHMLGCFAVFTYVAPLLTDVARLDGRLLPAVLFSFGLGSAAGVFAGGQFADRIGPNKSVRLAALATTIVLALASALPASPVPGAAAIFLAFMFVWGFVGWSFVPGQASRLVAMASAAPSLILSLNMTALYLGISAGSVLGGVILTYATARDLGWVAALFPLAGFVILVTGRRSVARVAAAQA